MGIKSALASGPTRKPGGPSCATCQWLATLTPELQEGARSLMANREWSNPALANEFKDDGLRASSGSLGRHRAGECVGERSRR